MEVEAIERRASLSDLALERVIEAIVKGDLHPGERIQEATLARQLGISRGPLREAISRLEGRSLVVRVPHKGVSIANPTDQEILEVFDIRGALEGVACRLAAERMTDAELHDLETIVREHASHSDVQSGDGYYQSPGDQDFHFKIIQASRSQRLISILLGDLYHFLRVFRYRSSVRKGRAKLAHDEHLAILDALLKRDGEAAEEAMRTHVTNARQSLTSRVSAQAAERA